MIKRTFEGNAKKAQLKVNDKVISFGEILTQMVRSNIMLTRTKLKKIVKYI